MKNLMSSLTLFIFISLLSSCFSPRPVIRLDPVAENTRWFQGREYSNDEQNGIGVSVSFREMQGDYLVMDVEVSNFSPLTVLVDPAKFFFQELGASPDFPGPSHFAFDPEQVILDIDKRKARLEAQRKNALVFVAVAAAAVTAAAIVNETKKDKNENSGDNSWLSSSDTQVTLGSAPNCDIVNEIGAFATLGAIANQRNFDYQIDQDNLDLMRNAWEEGTLRKTHLFPDETIQGTVVFNTDRFHKRGASLLNFNFPVEESKHRIIFQKKLHDASLSPKMGN